jgi:hypothetical protein
MSNWPDWKLDRGREVVELAGKGAVGCTERDACTAVRASCLRCSAIRAAPYRSLQCTLHILSASCFRLAPIYIPLRLAPPLSEA